MSPAWIAAVVALAASTAHADKKPVAKKKPFEKGFWKVLVQPNAKWVLHETIGDKSTLTVETYDVRKLGKADVARLRWTIGSGKDKHDVGDSGQGRYTQLAVTADGLYLLDADMDDAKVTAALAKKPARSDPPKAYEGTTQNHGRYLTIPGDGTACMGEGPMPGAGDCPDTCDGTICISPTAGIVSLMGNYAPGVSIFEQ
jgi:hypothetical protein